MKYMDPENEDVIKNLPPVVLTSSRSDFLRKHTLLYSKALKDAGHECELIYYPNKDKKLFHAFPTLDPDLPESEEVLDRITEWFNGIS